jgi:hypothetical protein
VRPGIAGRRVAVGAHVGLVSEVAVASGGSATAGTLLQRKLDSKYQTKHTIHIKGGHENNCVGNVEI